MTLAISIVAILISIASLIFNFHQYKNSKIVKQLEKSNEVLRRAYELKKASWELRDRYLGLQVDLLGKEEFEPDRWEGILDRLDSTMDDQISSIIKNMNITISDICIIESQLLGLDLELELLSKDMELAVDFIRILNPKISKRRAQ